jgi:Putative member of DMT superfamily (DUF486)
MFPGTVADLAALADRRDALHHRMIFPDAAGIPPLLERIATTVMLLFSNIFMTFAGYGHLKYKRGPLTTAIAVSWGIALFEYMLP